MYLAADSEKNGVIPLSRYAGKTTRKGPKVKQIKGRLLYAGGLVEGLSPAIFSDQGGVGVRGNLGQLVFRRGAFDEPSVDELPVAREVNHSSSTGHCLTRLRFMSIDTLHH